MRSPTTPLMKNAKLIFDMFYGLKRSRKLSIKTYNAKNMT